MNSMKNNNNKKSNTRENRFTIFGVLEMQSISMKNKKSIIKI
jgi:hypothetical protein